jgi:RNA polymerase sigma-70 factor (ECF subfamily)
MRTGRVECQPETDRGLGNHLNQSAIAIANPQSPILNRQSQFNSIHESIYNRQSNNPQSIAKSPIDESAILPAGTYPLATASNRQMKPAKNPSAWDDAELVGRIRRQDQAAFEVVMRRYNGKLFRVARAILRDDNEAEDALQDAYLDAYRHIDTFRGTAQLGTWLTKIVINHALMRLRKQRRHPVVVPFSEGIGTGMPGDEADIADSTRESPTDAALRRELRAMLERRIDQLPVAFRTVFVMREVEDMTVEETAACLSIPPATVRTRLFRARALLREALARDTDSATLEVFGFAGERCDRIVTTVLQTLQAPDQPAT